MMKRIFIGLSVSAVFAMAAALLTGLILEWPPVFGDPGELADVEGDFYVEGTALSPPLWGFLTFSLLTSLLALEDRWGAVAALGVIAFAGLFLVGYVVHTLSGPSPFVPTSALVAGGVSGSLLFLLVLTSGIAALLESGLAWKGGHS